MNNFIILGKLGKFKYLLNLENKAKVPTALSTKSRDYPMEKIMHLKR